MAFSFLGNVINYRGASSGSAPVVDVPNTTMNSIPGNILWLDALDPSFDGTVPASSTKPTSWKDKSGTGNHGSAANGVTYYDNSLNNLPTFSFTSLTTMADYFSGSISNTSNKMTILSVMNMNTSSPSAARLIGFSNASGTNDYNNSGYMGVVRQSLNGVQPYRNGTSVTNNPATANVPYLTECWFDGTTEYATVQQGSSTVINTTASIGNFAISFYSVGTNPNVADTAGFLTGYISEILVYNTALSTSDRQRIEGYLSWKWDLSAKLPTAHPYSTLVSAANIGYIPGLKWYRYAGNHGGNTSYTDTATLQSSGNNKPTSGRGVYNFTNIARGTSNNQLVDGNNSYSVLWLGYFFTGNNTGTFTFYTNSDDGSYLWIGPNATSGYTATNALVKNGGDHPMQTQSGTITLNANTYYPIRILFGENGGGDDIAIYFNLPGTSTNIYIGKDYYYYKF